MSRTAVVAAFLPGFIEAGMAREDRVLLSVSVAGAGRHKLTELVSIAQMLMPNAGAAGKLPDAVQFSLEGCTCTSDGVAMLPGSWLGDRVIPFSIILGVTAVDPATYSMRATLMFAPGSTDAGST